MDMNQSPLSRLKTNKTGITRQASENRAAAEAVRSKAVTSGTSAQSIKQPDLREGQIVKGEIIDHRYNEVKIQLEPGKQVISAKLSGDIPLSIGQQAKFQVTEDSSEQLVLKYIPEEAAPAETTIQKALTASGLPITERSKAIVSELLNERMPVDKQTLQTLVRLSVSNREASPLTLVLMFKNSIPMTPANIKQFEAYQTGTQQQLQDIRSITHSITDLLRQSDADSAILQQDRQDSALLQKDLQDTAVLQLDQSDRQLKNSQSSINQPISMTPDKNSPFTKALQMNNGLIKILTDASGQAKPSSADIPINQILSREELTLLSKTIALKIMSGSQDGNLADISDKLTYSKLMNPSDFIRQSTNASDLTEQLNKGNINLEETVKLITGLYSDNSEISKSLQISGIINQIRTQVDAPVSEVLSKLLGQLDLTDKNLPKLADFLKPDDRASLLGYVTASPDKAGIKEHILQGTASLKETLTFLQESLNRMEKPAANTLLQSPEYSKLIEDAFLQRWTITPDKIAKKLSVTQFFDQLKDDLESLSSLTWTDNGTQELRQIQEPVRNLQDNLQFMKDLNEAFTFLQLPVQLKDRQAHADLYVLTRKKAISDKRENLSVLLHLDMTNLGPLNVYLQMKPGNQLQADFYLENSEAGRLINENLPSLTAVLQKKGYTIQAEVKSSYKSPDFGRDFIEQSSADHLIQRYTFDIRT